MSDERKQNQRAYQRDYNFELFFVVLLIHPFCLELKNPTVFIKNIGLEGGRGDAVLKIGLSIEWWDYLL